MTSDIEMTLSRVDQIQLNARALWLDLWRARVDRLSFHARGLWRGLVGL